MPSAAELLIIARRRGVSLTVIRTMGRRPERNEPPSRTQYQAPGLVSARGFNAKPLLRLTISSPSRPFNWTSLRAVPELSNRIAVGGRPMCRWGAGIISDDVACDARELWAPKVRGGYCVCSWDTLDRQLAYSLRWT